jgi:LysR family nod box-dependent transcriptional activator
LLVQVGRNMVLTPLAEELVEPVRNVMLQIRATVEIRPKFDPATSRRHFRIISSDYPATVLLAGVARRLHTVAPHITIEIMAPQDGYVEMVDRGEVDMLIMPEKYLSPNHQSQRLFEDDYTCIAWSSNSVLGETLSLEQFKAMGHVSILFGSQRRAPGFEDWFMSSAGIARRIETTADTFNGMPQFVIGTNRIATMHSRLARVYAHYFPLRLYKPPVAIPPVVECMQWHKFFDKDAAHIWFRQVLIDVAAEDGAHYEGY